MYTVSGNQMLKDGKPFVMRGYNLGNWMNLERFMFGFPGVDHLFRRNLLYYGGQEKYDFFFDNYYRVYFQERDAAFLKKLGCNALRIPFNYRVFESDQNPFAFSEKPFRYMDAVIDMCAKYDIGVVIDYHAVQGFQAWGHCVDNITGDMPLYYDQQCQDRFVALWKFVANHYKDNPNVITYDLMNEPTPTEQEFESLRQIYRKAIAGIREMDQTHIISIEGTEASTCFDETDERFDGNMAFSPHIYPKGPKYTERADRSWRKAQLIKEIDRQTAAARKLNVPVWYGETGLKSDADEENRLELLDLTLEILNERGYGWTLWTYKDSGQMGLVTAKEDSPWLERTKKYAGLKKKYQLDTHFPVDMSTTEKIFAMIDEDFDTETVINTVMASTEADYVKHALWINIVNAIGKAFAGGFAKIFADRSQEELMEMIRSFELENCDVKDRWYEIISRRTQE